MPKVIEHKARKDYPDAGIVKGDLYYQWSLRPYGTKGVVYRSKTYPTPRQLTSNEFQLALYDLDDALAGITAETIDDLETARDDICQQIRDLASEQEDKLSNMPDGLQEGDAGQTLQDRVDNLEAWADDIENVDLPDPENLEEGETLEDAINHAIDEIKEQGYPG